MGSDDRRQALEQARLLEESGDRRGAVDLYLRGGAPLQAARVVALGGRPSDAGDLLIRAIGGDAAAIGLADAGRRRLAMAAAFYFIRAKDAGRAAEVMVALGERDRAILALEQAGEHAAAARLRGDTGTFEVAGDGAPGGDTVRQPVTFGTTIIAPPPEPSHPAAGRERARKLEAAGKLQAALRGYLDSEAIYDAARVAYKLKMPGEAAELLVEIQRYYEAAKCFVEARAPDQALAALLRVDPGHARYAKAAVQVIHLALARPELPGQLASFLGPWLEQGAAGVGEGLLYGLATRLDRDARVDGARRVYGALLARDPGYKDAAERLRRLHGGSDPKRRRRARTSGAHRAIQTPEETTQVGRPAIQPPVTFDAPAVSFDPGPGFAAVAAGPPPATERTSPTPAATGPSRPVSSPAELIAPGTMIDERYRVEAKLGEGASATVLEVSDLELGERVAMKLFHMSFSDNETYARRMKRELRLCRRLAHPNIIRLYDMGKYMAHRYLTMELLEGRTLKQLLVEDVSYRQLFEYLAQSCLGLHEAHRRGIIHRDVKPDNLFLTTDDVVKVMDFGIAKQGSAEAMTLTGTILGTPGYMAPEQIDGSADVTAAADQYALGAVAYRLLTRTKVFHHPDIVPLLMMHATNQPDPPSKRNPDLLPAVDALVLRLLAKAPDDRFPGLDEVAVGFREIATAYP